MPRYRCPESAQNEQADTVAMHCVELTLEYGLRASRLKHGR